MKPTMTTAQFRGEMAKDRGEAGLQEDVIALARTLGWLVAHFRPVRIQRANGGVYYETPVGADGQGWPDLVLVRDRVLYVELKRENGTLEPAQRVWRDRIKEAGATWLLWRPRDWESGAIQRELTSRASG